MTRLIDLLCPRHRDLILDTRIWPADCPITGTFAAYLGCGDCGNQPMPGNGLDIAEQAAIHEAGHAVMYTHVGIDIEYAHIDPTRGDSGHVRLGAFTASRSEFLTGLWGGVAACLHWLDRMRLLDDAAIVDMAVCGIGDLQFGMRHEPGRDVHAAAMPRVVETVAAHWDAVERVADMLLARGRLSGPEIADLAGMAGCSR